MPLRLDHGSEPLVGRDAELAALRDLVAQATDRGGAVLIVGDAGTGKTAILRRIVTDAKADGFAAVVTGAAARRTAPFSVLDPLVPALRNHVDNLPSAERLAIERAFDPGADADPVAVGRGVLRALRAAASGAPLVVAVDDLHLLDPRSAAAIAEIGRLAARGPVVVVGTTRPGSSHQSFGARQSIIELRALDDADARLVMERHSHVDDVQGEQVLRNAAGNPLALIELPKAIASITGVVSSSLSPRMPLTPMLRRSFAQGLHELSPAARDAALIAAIEDETAVHELVAATSALVGHEVGIEGFDEVVGVGMLRGDDMRLHFRHELMRSVVLDEETLARRQRAHKAIAEVLGDGPRRVWHEAQSVPIANEHLSDELEQVYPLTLARGTTAAIAVLERAAQLTTDPDKRARRLLRAADLASTLGRADAVDRFLTAASQHPISATRQGHADVLRARFAEGRAHIEPRALCDLADQAVDEGDHQLALDLLLAAAERSWWVDADRDTRAAIDERVSAIPGEVDEGQRAAIRALTAPIANGGAVFAGLASIDTALVRDTGALRNFGMAAHAIGDVRRAAELFAEAEARCRADGLLGVLPQVLCLQADARLELGDWQRATALAGEAVAVAESTEQWNWVAAAKLVLARAYAWQGEGERALVLAGESEHLAETRGLHGVRAQARVARGSAWLGAGRYVEAYDELVALFEDRATRDNDRERMSAIMLLVEAAVHTEHDDDVRSIMAGVEATGFVSPSPLLRVQLHYARSVLATEADAEDRYREAFADDLVGWPWVRARLELAYGSWLRRQRRVVESRSRLRAACDTLEVIGANTWAEQARTELRAAGERMDGRRDADGGALEDVLSPQELEIARLAAEGLSNREIGQRLFLSHRTVGSHLYRIFPKLGITSRRYLFTSLNPASGAAAA
jgi:DNA-binding CsgD family transcriptional regulator/tetratricopeptide (TPR) repeat protein